MCYWLPLQKHCYLLPVKPDSCSSHQHADSNSILALLNPLILTSPFMMSWPKQFVTCFSAADCDSDLVTQRSSRRDVIALSGQRSASQGLDGVFTLVWAVLLHTQDGLRFFAAGTALIRSHDFVVFSHSPVRSWELSPVATALSPNEPVPRVNKQARVY